MPWIMPIPTKQVIARKIISDTPKIVISTQVLNEFYVVTTRKMSTPLPPAEAEEMVAQMSKFSCLPVDAELVSRAIRLGRDRQLAHWDALMLASALRGKCDRLLSEDLATGAILGGVTIENPFAM